MEKKYKVIGLSVRINGKMPGREKHVAESLNLLLPGWGDKKDSPFYVEWQFDSEKNLKSAQSILDSAGFTKEP